MRPAIFRRLNSGPPVVVCAVLAVTQMFVIAPRCARAMESSASPAPHRLQNIAARSRVLTQDRVLIGGFIVQGSDSIKVVIRAIGSSLRAGVAPLAGRLIDPTLELYAEGSGVPLASNDDWRERQQSEIMGTGLAPADDHESAIVATLAPGSYTAIVRGRTGATGIAVVEAYDASSSTAVKLANISARSFVQTGDDVLIGGIIAGGGETDGSIRIVARAIGPSLANRGISDALADPTLELVNSNGSGVAFSDNASDERSLELQETGLAPPHALEAAVVVTLGNGNYTAVVRGVNGTTGTALVEFFDVPPGGPGR